MTAEKNSECRNESRGNRSNALATYGDVLDKETSSEEGTVDAGVPTVSIGSDEENTSSLSHVKSAGNVKSAIKTNCADHDGAASYSDSDLIAHFKSTILDSTARHVCVTKNIAGSNAEMSHNPTKGKAEVLEPTANENLLTIGIFSL